MSEPEIVKELNEIEALFVQTAQSAQRVDGPIFLQTGSYRRAVPATGRRVSSATLAGRSSSGFGATERIASRRIR